MNAETTDRLRGRTQMVLAHVEATGDQRPLSALLRQVRDELGPASELALYVEYTLEELLSRTRPVRESALVWAGLHARAEAALHAQDTTLMMIKGLRVRYTRLSGTPEDRDAAVDSYEVEWLRRLKIFGPEAPRTCTAHGNLATALRERGEPADLRRAARIARAEVALRTARWGEDNDYTWIAEAILAQTLLRIAELDDASRALPPAPEVPAHGAYPVSGIDDLARPTADLVADALCRSQAVLTRRRERFGPTSRAALRAQLTHAHALLLSGEPERAADEIRYVMATSRRVGAQLDPGSAELLLARALLAAGLTGGCADEALRLAQDAVAARQAAYPAGTDRLTEAERVAREALRLAGGAGPAEATGQGTEGEGEPPHDDR